jgi:hypothetical protein
MSADGIFLIGLIGVSVLVVPLRQFDRDDSTIQQAAPVLKKLL